MNLRIRALERRKLPEELDQLSGLARSWSWLGVGALGLAVAALVAWSFFGRIPRTVSGSGVIAVPGGLAAVDSTVSGPVKQVLVSQDEYVRAGQPIAVIGSGGQKRSVTAPFTGQVIDQQVIQGQVVGFGTQLFTVQRTLSGVQGESAYLFVPSASAAGLAPGMRVNVTVSTAPSAAFGVLHGKITTVSASPLSTAAVTALVANPNLAQILTEHGPPLLAHVRLIPDGATRSGFAWSTPKGPPFPLQAGTPITAQVVQSQQRPIDVIFGT